MYRLEDWRKNSQILEKEVYLNIKIIRASEINGKGEAED